MIDVVEEEKSKIEPLLPQLKRMVDDHGIINLYEIDAI
jgi:hypothetical protein